MEAVDLNILGVSELAERWGVSRQYVNQVAQQPQLGRYKQLACGRVWTLSQVIAYEEWRAASGLPFPVRPTEG